MRRAKRILIIGTDSHYQREVLKGIQQYCSAHGQWEYHWKGSSSREAMALAKQVVRHWHPDGIIAHVQYRRALQLVERSGITTINVSAIFKTHLPTVVSDHREMGRLAARHFLENGFQHFGLFIDGWSRFFADRMEGFQEELRQWRRTDQVSVFEAPEAMTVSEPVRRKLNKWLQGLPKPAAVTCMYDTSAQEVALACQRLGILVPDEIGIVGMGNQEIICRMISPPLSSVDPASVRVGYEAAKLMDRMLRGRAAPRQMLLVPPTGVVARASSDFVAADDAEVAAAMRLIRSRAHEGLGVKQLQAQVAISRKTLERRFRKQIGHSPRQEIVRVRMQRIKGLLQDRDVSIKEVIRSTGFQSRRAFALFFRREMKMSPGQYRRRSGGKE